MNSNLTLGYWNVSYKAQPVRYVLELANHPYVDKQYDFKDQQEWNTAKETNSLNLSYPNLPYIIDGENRITESQNVIIYAVDITNQQGLRGTGLNKYKVDNIRFLCDDLGRKIIVAAFNLKGDEQRKSYDADVIPKMKQLANDLGKKVYYFENKLTLADLYVYTTILLLKRTNATEYKQFADSFEAFTDNFESIPTFKKYHETPRYKQMIL